MILCNGGAISLKYDMTDNDNAKTDIVTETKQRVLSLCLWNC